MSASSRSFAIVNGTLVLPDRLIEDGLLVCDRGLITIVGRSRKIPATAMQVDASGGFVCPGFIDIHVHGGAGADFMDGTTDAVRTAVLAHARHGTTTIVPTTTTGSFDQIMSMISACQAVSCERKSGLLPTIPGVHLYGPYFAADKAGCHSKAGCRDPLLDEYRRYLETGFVRVATCAAELPGATEFYQLARRRRCLITCGHSNASWMEMQSAFDAGMRHVDHFWCAMSSVPSLRQRLGTPMQGSMAEFVLMNPEMSTEVIADGCHLAPELLEFAYRMKGANRLCLVTDCNRALDQPPGEFHFGNAVDDIRFRSDGLVGRMANGSLASSVKGMDHMVRHMHRNTSANLCDVIRMATLTPAERTGLARSTGSLEVGKRADVLILDRELHVRQVFASGRVVA